jgi:NADH dehydrogenase/NADH:ubiquinone oxidoreductase subunit G
MSDLTLTIDGRTVKAAEGMSVLTAARDAGIEIPTLCWHEAQEPHGGCRMCIVELDFGDWSRLVVSCVYPAAEGLVVRTRTEKIDRLRRMILELLMAHAPDSEPLKKLAAEYGAKRDRFEAEPDFCIHCGLCVRYCAEVKKKNAIGFIDRGVKKEIAFVPEIASVECDSCKECFPLCPTSYVQAVWVLTESLAGG